MRAAGALQRARRAGGAAGGAVQGVRAREADGPGELLRRAGRLRAGLRQVHHPHRGEQAERRRPAQPLQRRPEAAPPSWRGPRQGRRQVLRLPAPDAPLRPPRHRRPLREQKLLLHPKAVRLPHLLHRARQLQCGALPRHQQPGSHPGRAAAGPRAAQLPAAQGLHGQPRHARQPAHAKGCSAVPLRPPLARGHRLRRRGGGPRAPLRRGRARPRGAPRAARRRRRPRILQLGRDAGDAQGRRGLWRRPGPARDLDRAAAEVAAGRGHRRPRHLLRGLRAVPAGAGRREDPRQGRRAHRRRPPGCLPPGPPLPAHAGRLRARRPAAHPAEAPRLFQHWLGPGRAARPEHPAHAAGPGRRGRVPRKLPRGGRQRGAGRQLRGVQRRVPARAGRAGGATRRLGRAAAAAQAPPRLPAGEAGRCGAAGPAQGAGGRGAAA